jgi:hypothetical protein
MPHTKSLDLDLLHWPKISETKNTYLLDEKIRLSHTYFRKGPVTPATWRRALSDMEWLALQMGVRGKTTDSKLEAQKIPAGYTYFAQFVAHDITLNTTTFAANPTRTLRRGVDNRNSPALDLDLLYRGGPQVSPQLYAPTEGRDLPRDRTKLRLGLTRKLTDIRPDPALEDLPRFSVCPHQTNSDKPQYESLVGDDRNKENLILAQLVVQFHKLHNYYVDHANAFNIDKNLGLSPAEIFEMARWATTESYHNMITQDFLPVLTGLAPVSPADFEEEGADEFRGKPLPVEFNSGVLRIFHSMVRQKYEFPASLKPSVHNPKKTRLERHSIGVLLFQDSEPLSSRFVVSDWNQFFPQVDGNGDWTGAFNKARKVQAAIAPDLISSDNFPSSDYESTKGDDVFGGGVAFRDLARGLLNFLPTGEILARQYRTEILSAETISNYLGANFDAADIVSMSVGFDDVTAILNRLANAPPLALYLAIEAELSPVGPGRMGPLAAKIMNQMCCAFIDKEQQAENRDQYMAVFDGVLLNHIRELPALTQRSGLIA